MGLGDYLLSYPEIIQINLKPILGGQEGIHQIPLLLIPLGQTPVVKVFQIILDDEGDNIMLQTLLEEDQPPHTAVAVLEGVDTLEGHMEGHDVLKGLGGQRIVACQQFPHFRSNILREGCVTAAHLVGELLVFAHGKPIFAAVAGAGLQHRM